MDVNNIIKEAVEVLRAGGVILYPTDTVWGIGCDATNPEAVAKVYQIKNRADSKSLVLLADNLDMVARYVKQVPDVAIQLVEVNDKPMTIIYPGAYVGPSPAELQEGEVPAPVKGKLAYNTVAQDGSVGIRIPMMEFCRMLVGRLGRPLVSTSANPSGEPSPKKFSEISDQIKEAMDYIVPASLEKGATGKPSSIIKVGLDSSIEIIRK